MVRINKYTHPHSDGTFFHGETEQNYFYFRVFEAVSTPHLFDRLGWLSRLPKWAIPFWTFLCSVHLYLPCCLITPRASVYKSLIKELTESFSCAAGKSAFVSCATYKCTKHKDCCCDLSQHPYWVTHGITSTIITIAPETSRVYFKVPQHHDMQYLQFERCVLYT